MKSKRGWLGWVLVSVLMVLAMPVRAQQATNAPMPTPANWFNTAVDWLSSQDTNATLFEASSFTLWAGNSYVNNANNASTLGLDFRVWRIGTNGLQLTVESETRNAGISGTIYSQQAGLQVSKVLHDIRLGGFVDGGYSFQVSRPYVEAGVDLRKALGKVSFMYTRVGYQFVRKEAAGVFEAGIGVVF